ncbi:MAG: hypothetical protein BWY54_00559 [Candidatus Dependentiae bacterium ADurb.Bin331]|nr:MAG: hypothetical protein BWY54_00559 [Candidatus Dependentiae bacterium ADurb.Bin331]
MKRWLRICTLLLLTVQNELWAGGEMPPKPITQEEVKKLILETMEPSTFDLLWKWKCFIIGGVACATGGVLLYKRARKINNRINQELENTEKLKLVVTGKVDEINKNLGEQGKTIEQMTTKVSGLSTSINSQLSTVQQDLNTVHEQQNQISKSVDVNITEYKEQFTKTINDNNKMSAIESGDIIATIKKLNSTDDKNNEELTKKIQNSFGEFVKETENIEQGVRLKTKSIVSDTAAMESLKNVTSQEINSVTTNIESLGQLVEGTDLSDSTKRIGSMQKKVDVIQKNNKEREKQLKKLAGLLETRNTRQPQTVSNRARSASPSARMPNYINNNNNNANFKGSLIKNDSVNSGNTSYSRRSSIGNWEDNNNNNNVKSSKEEEKD